VFVNKTGGKLKGCLKRENILVLF